MDGEKLRSYRELRVWQAAKELAKAAYVATGKFPSQERFGLTSQMRRAAISVPANIAEGYGRNNRREYVQFLGIANGSLREFETYVIIASEMGLLKDATELLQVCDDIGRMLSGLITKLRAEARSSPEECT